MKKAFKLVTGLVLAAALVGSVCAFAACGDSGDDSGTTGGGGTTDGGGTTGGGTTTTSGTYTMVVDDIDDYIDMVHEGELPMIHFNYIYGNGIAWQYQSISEVDFELALSDGTYTLVETVWSSKDSTSAQYYIDTYTATGSYTAVSDTEYTLAAATSVIRTFVASDNFISQGVFGNTGDTTMTNEYNCPGCTATIDNSDMSVSFSDSTAKYVDISDEVEEEEEEEDVVIVASKFALAEDGESATLESGGITLTFRSDGKFTGVTDVGGGYMYTIIYGKWSMSGNYVTIEKWFTKKVTNEDGTTSNMDGKDEDGNIITDNYETKDAWKVTATTDYDENDNLVYSIYVDPTGAYSGSGYTYFYYTADNATALAGLLSTDAA